MAVCAPAVPGRLRTDHPGRGVSPTQYQLLLFTRGDPARAPTIADLAERLQIMHQSAVGLVDRCAAAGIVRRRRDESNRRRVFVTTTARGGALLDRLAPVSAPRKRRS